MEKPVSVPSLLVSSLPHQSTKRKNFVIWSQGHRPTSRGSTRRSCCCRGAPRHDRVPRCSALRLCRSCTPRARRPGTNRFDRKPTGHSGAPSAPNELRQHRHHILGTSSSCEACWANGLCSSYKPFPRAREATRARDSSLPVSWPCSQIHVGIPSGRHAYRPARPKV